MSANSASDPGSATGKSKKADLFDNGQGIRQTRSGAVRRVAAQFGRSYSPGPTLSSVTMP
jgi:hypothetical protein